MKKHFLAIISILSFFAVSAQEPAENALFLKENSPKTYMNIKSFAEAKWNGNNNMIVHEISKQANSAMYFNTISETVDSDKFYSAIKKCTEQGLTNWSHVEYEYKKQFKKFSDRGGFESNISNPNINIKTQEKTHREEFGLKGNVKTIKATSYKEVEKFGGIIKENDRKDKNLEKDFYYIFNKDGYKTQEYKYDSDGSLYSEFKYKYNNKGNIKLIRGSASLLSFLAPTDYYYFFEYDSNENMILESHYQSANLNLVYSYDYIYDETNSLIETNHYKSDESIVSKSEYKYNDQGNKIEENYFESAGNLESQTKYEYDDKGNLIKWSRYKPDGSIAYKGAFEYDDNGNTIEKGGYTYTYEYDEEGNWILKTEFSDNAKGYIIEREIEYFE
ncbi:MAG: hypothetical protein ACI83B_000312 [Sediminicola sp.]|jgi:hypothetical protein|tara:strand:+ start:4303 stop:5469 length:1167 start_codon:yes stop_codon:yes gene_type:complete